MSSPLLEQLRSATRPRHHALDHHPLLAPLSGAKLDTAAYAQALASLHAPFAGHEALVRRHPEWTSPGHPYVPFSRLAALESDLRQLGRAPTAPTPALHALPPLTSPAQLIGVLYVLEGSALGGQVLERLIAERLPSAPCTFLAGSGERTASQWAGFRNFAEAVCPADARADAAAAAVACFERFLSHLDVCNAAARP